jgi:YebC/PmpR family DNA-binding regulatory protein
MSGHSKWSTIKHKKAALDAKRGKAWSKVSRDITVAAKMGGGDPEMNPRLRLAIDKAKSANMPKDNVERAIKKGTGDLEGANYEECLYEGYGPGGVAVMCSALTDNRARTGPEIKKIFERSGGNLGAANSVSWMFALKGVIVISASGVEEDKVMEIAIEAGAEDVSISDICYEVTCDPESYLAVKEALEAAKMPIESAEVTNVASNEITVGDVETARKVMRLLDNLEDYDDTQSVSSNADIPDEIVAQLADD